MEARILPVCSRLVSFRVGFTFKEQDIDFYNAFRYTSLR